jgi:hypothetical protein
MSGWFHGRSTKLAVMNGRPMRLLSSWISERSSNRKALGNVANVDPSSRVCILELFGSPSQEQ